MDYCFEADSWGASFSFPWAAAAGHIKSCSEAQIKILLCILAGPRYTDSSSLAELSGYSESDVDEAVAYWHKAGVIYVNGEKSAPVKSEATHKFSGKNEPVSVVESVKPTKASAVERKITVKYSQREMLQKAENDAALRSLINEIQSLQFSINGSELAKLIELYELYKFDAPSILLAADHCRAAGKCSIAYLHTVMINWYNEGINTYAEVEQAIITSAERRSFENKILGIFGMENKPSKKQQQYMSEWKRLGFNFDLIELAYNKCLDTKSKLSFSYIDGILKNWANNGITSVEQAEDSDIQHKKKYSAVSEDKPSYDLNEYENFARNYDFGDAPWNNRKDGDQ